MGDLKELKKELELIKAECKQLAQQIEDKVEEKAIQIQEKVEEKAIQIQEKVDQVKAEFEGKVNQIEEKLDRVLSILDDLKSNRNNENEEERLLSSLPLGEEDFIMLNKTIAENSSFRERLITKLNFIGGKDVKVLTANLLRKLVKDQVGETFSLTGKSSKDGIIKNSFEKTEIYKVIVEICFRAFNSKETETREVISGWLTQSKFRKSRRDARRGEEEPEDEE